MDALDAKLKRDEQRQRNQERVMKPGTRLKQEQNRSTRLQELERVSPTKHIGEELSMGSSDLIEGEETVLSPRTPLQSMADGPREVALTDLIKPGKKRGRQVSAGYEMIAPVKSVIALDDEWAEPDEEWERVERPPKHTEKPSYAQILKT